MSSYIQIVGAPPKKPRLPAKTLRLLNVYRDLLTADASYHAHGGNDKELKSSVCKARRELVKHLLEL